MLIANPRALEIVRRLQARGFGACYAGGCVRDALLGRPADDIDIATSATPAEVTALFPRTVQVGAHFGVVKVLWEGDEFDVAAFRVDGAYLDGRHPSSVSFASPEEDARRRDITINGMFYDPVADRVIDFVGGQADLAARIVRAIGDPAARIEEDKLRLMRVVRFAAVLNFAIDPATLAAVREHHAGIRQVAMERVNEEFSKMLAGPRPAAAMRLLLETGLMGVILPEVTTMAGVEQPPEFHPEGDVLQHTLLMFDLLEQGLAAGRFRPSLRVALGVLFHDIAKPLTFFRADRIRFHGHCERGATLTEKVLTRLKFPNRTVTEVAALVAQHMRFVEAPHMREAKLKRFLRQDFFDDHLILHYLDCMASHRDLSSFNLCTVKLAEFGRVAVLKPPLLVNGRDLIALGYTPGPLFREVLEYIEDMQLEGAFGSKEEALAAVRAAFPAGRGAGTGGSGQDTA